MDELQLIRDFRSSVPPAAAETRRQARELLAERFESKHRAVGLPRHAFVWAAAALLAAILAGSALAFGDRLLDLIRGKPAPPSVRQELAQVTPRSVIPYFDYPTVIKSRIHGVLAFDTARGPMALWVGPTRRGGACYLYRKLRPRTVIDRVGFTAGCVPPHLPRRLSTIVAALEAPEGLDFGYVWGYTAKNVPEVEVHLADGEVKRVPVFERFFGVGVPATTSLVSAIALDKHGHEVGRCCSLPPAPPQTPPEPPRSGPYKTVFDLVQGGHRFMLAVAPARGGGLCTDLSSPGRPHERGCVSHPARLQPLGFGMGSPPPFAFFAGRAGDGIASVELRYEDGSSEHVPLRERFFLKVVTGSHTRRGHRPLLFIARAASGRSVATEHLSR